MALSVIKNTPPSPPHSCCQRPKFRPKSSKGAGEKSWLEEVMANFGQILPEVEQKGPKKIF
jgi:hypothetical protein